MENTLNNNQTEPSSPEEQPKTKKPTRACTLIAKRNYYARNKERILEAHKQWRINNKEKLTEMQKESNKKLKEKKELQMKLMQRLVESQDESDEEDLFIDRISEMIHIANFYQQLGIKNRPIDFAPTYRH
jgi:flagellar biosynthesis component FlhA